MIQLVIASKSKEQLEEIAGYLLKSRLIISIDFHQDIRRMELENSTLKNCNFHFITGKTKPLLFSEIDFRLRNKYKDNIPEIYAHPIINMDWVLVEKLRSETEKI